MMCYDGQLVVTTKRSAITKWLVLKVVDGSDFNAVQLI